MRAWFAALIVIAGAIACASPSPPRATQWIQIRIGDVDPRTGVLTEVHILSDGEIRLREANSRGWPFCFDRVALYRLPADDVAWLDEQLWVSGYWQMPTVVDDGAPAGGRFTSLAVSRRGRQRSVSARELQDPRLTWCLHLIAQFLPRDCAVVAALPPPGGASTRAATRALVPGQEPAASAPATRPGAPVPPVPFTPPLAPVADIAQAIRFHEAWLVREPERKSLHLDLFALELKRGDRDAARRHAQALRGDSTYGVVVDDLLARL